MSLGIIMKIPPFRPASLQSLSLSALLLVPGAGCSLETAEGGDTGPEAAGTGAAAQIGSGGAASGGAATGEAVISAGGLAGTGGFPGSGGAAPVGSGGLVSGGTGGDTGGGTGGDPTPGTGGTEPGGKPAPRPSAGCGKTNPATGTSSNPLTDGKPYYVKLPSGYDANTPYRLLFVFNPTGNPITWAENSAGYENLSAKDNAIRVYPHQNPNDLSRSPGGWSGSDVPSFEPLYNAVLNNFCVDEERVFATGESSGGDFASVLGCEHGDKLRGIGPCATKPVNGYPLDASQRNCVGNVTAIVIHGQNDSVVGSANGPATRDFYTDVNGCSENTEPVAGYTDDQSNCVMFTGCTEGSPVYWCQHQDPNYSGTQHGWPKFAAKMTWEIFESY